MRRKKKDTWDGWFWGAGLQNGVSTYNLKSDSYNVSANVLASHNSAPFTFAGYDVLLRSRFLAGAEAAVSASQFHHKTVSGFGALNVAQSWTWEASARLGYLISPSSLVFGRLGVTQSPLKASLDIAGRNVPSYSKSVEQNPFGFFMGIGVEVKFDGPWSLRLEYDRFYFSSLSLRDDSSLTSGWNTWHLGRYGGARENTAQGIGKLALIYRFGVDEKREISVSTKDWSGFYAGSSVGGVDVYAEASIPQYGITSRGVGLSAPSALIYAGYNWSLLNRWLLGFEGELYPGFTANNVTMSPMMVTKVRAGYAISSDTLIYASLGFSTAYVNEKAYVNNQYVQNGVTIPKQNVHAVPLGLGVENKLDE